MGDTQMTARWYEQVRREKRAKDKWQAKYLTEEQLELERQAEAAALSELRGRPKHKKLSERDAMLMRLAAVEREAGEAADEEAAGEEGGAATGGVPQARRMTAHQVARERIRQEVAATRERNHRITHDLTTESLLNDLGPALWISFNAGYKHPGATPGTRTGVSTIQKTHIYDPKADGAAKWSADNWQKQSRLLRVDRKPTGIGTKRGCSKNCEGTCRGTFRPTYATPALYQLHDKLTAWTTNKGDITRAHNSMTTQSTWRYTAWSFDKSITSASPFYP